MFECWCNNPPRGLRVEGFMHPKAWQKNQDACGLGQTGLQVKALHGRNVTSRLNGLLSGPVALFDKSRTTLVVSPMDNFKHSVQLGILLGFLCFMLPEPARRVTMKPRKSPHPKPSDSAGPKAFL